jgi:seryl-tRNA synthetase
VFDVKAIRDNPAAFDGGLKRRGIDSDFSSAVILALDDQRKAIVTELQECQARRNAASKEIGKAMGAKDSALADKLKAEVAGLKDKIAAGEARQKALDQEIETYLAVIPNTPLDEVPLGADETGNKEVRRIGEPPKLAFEPKEHFELGEALGMMDFETAQKVSGARFVFLKGGLARLDRALAQFMLDIHTEEFGYTEVVPPMLVRDEAAYGTANLPKFANDLFIATRVVARAELLHNALNFATPADLDDLKRGTATLTEVVDRVIERAPTKEDLWLIPTAEISLTNLAREQIIDEDKLPMRYTAHTPCFRSEAGAAGRDTRGMIRQHQFSKVELVSITTPEKSLEEHERMTKAAETVLQRLGLAYRTMLLCTGDMGFASQKTYDIEVWLPGQDTYREISSCSVCGDFQARRMSARYRPKADAAAGGKGKASDVRYVHTLNGSGLAVGRTLIAVMENYQQADGSIRVPDALVPYMGGKTVIAKA